MANMPILEVAIGLTFVYLLLALVCTAVNETIAGITERRADMLKDGIARLLHDSGLRDTLYQHPLIRGLGEDDAKPPSYIASGTFALALTDSLRKDAAATGSSEAASFRQRDGGLGNAEFWRAFHSVVGDAPHLRRAISAEGTTADAELDLKRIEAWFDAHMDRVSGWYKRKTQAWVLGLALMVTLVTNADTVRISRTLWQNPTLRSAVVESARSRAQMERPEELIPLVAYPDPEKPTKSKPIVFGSSQVVTQQERELMGQLLGWSSDLAPLRGFGWPAVWWVLVHLVGWSVTVIAVSQGAPFWFDTLNRFVNMRHAGRAPAEQRDKAQPEAGLAK